MDDSTAHAFGRVEAKIDGVGVQVGTLAVAVAEHGIRLSHLEAAVAELRVAEYGTRMAQLEHAMAERKTEDDNDTRQRVTVRGALTVGMSTVMASGLVSWLVQVITK